MKRTKKRVAAERKATELGIRNIHRIHSDDLYQTLEGNGLIWDHKQGEWVEGSKSIFADHTGEPTGIVKVRVMGHPDDIEAWLEDQSHYRMIEVSENYQNRRGAGQRVYTTWKEQ